MDTNFEELVKGIHRFNSAWHSSIISNKFLNNSNKYLQNHYLKKKQDMQSELMNTYKDRIILGTDEKGKTIMIKKEYQFSTYYDACHYVSEGVNNG